MYVFLLFSQHLFLTGESWERLQFHPPGAVVGPGHNDDGGVRGHGAEDLPGYVRGCSLRHGRRARGGPPRPRHRLQLCHVLLSHTGPGKHI